MKIPVHEIEGNYYCAIDDIAKFKAIRQKQSISPLDTAKKIYENHPIFWDIKNTTELVGGDFAVTDDDERFSTSIPDDLPNKDNILFFCVANVVYQPVRQGLYEVAIAVFLDRHQGEFYYIPDYEYQRTPTRIDIKSVIINRGNHQEITPIFSYFGAKWHKDCPVDNDDNPFPVSKTNTKDLYLTQLDAQTYLADCDIADSNFVPATALDTVTDIPLEKPKDNQTEMHVKETDNTLPYLDKNNEKYAPYLDIALEMCQRYFINGERNREGKSTNSDKENIIKLLDGPVGKLIILCHNIRQISALVLPMSNRTQNSLF
ncbi:MAG: hypothetical protein CSA45_02145, partial [Gammaproteobacteria bacterium]